MSNKDLIAYMSDKVTVDKEEIISLFGDIYQLPSYEKLSKSYIASKISQALSRARDDEGRRLILAKRSEGITQYVNIPVCNDTGTLEHIKLRISRDIFGQRASLEKVDLQLEDVQRGKRRGRRSSKGN